MVMMLVCDIKCLGGQAEEWYEQVKDPTFKAAVFR